MHMQLRNLLYYS